jgi:fumarate hydratase subunit beta
LIKIELPVAADKISELKVGDLVSISGVMVTARDAAHKYLVENYVDREPPAEEQATADKIVPILKDGIIYHCGPVVEQDESGKWHFVAAGPTTSIREEPYQGAIIGHFGVRGVIGKGGMGANTLAACKEHKAVYLHAVGGAASLLATHVVEVLDVMKAEEFGLPEAFWVIRVDGFNAVVTMDSHGNSLHKDVQDKSDAALDGLIKEIRDGK